MLKLLQHNVSLYVTKIKSYLLNVLPKVFEYQKIIIILVDFEKLTVRGQLLFQVLGHRE